MRPAVRKRLRALACDDRPNLARQAAHKPGMIVNALARGGPPMQAVSTRPAPQMPLVAGRYELKRLLGQGGMGEVQEALDTSSGKRVALKRLHAHVPAELFALFEREYHTLASLRHPRIVEVYEYGNDANGAYYTMELLEGCDLSKLAPMPWRAVCACLRDTASILGVLHARRLIHRDLSPKNLWRTPDGRLKLIDFGSLAPFGRVTGILGTP